MTDKEWEEDIIKRFFEEVKTPSILDDLKPKEGTMENSNFMQVVPDSQYYDDLKQILFHLEWIQRLQFAATTIEKTGHGVIAYENETPFKIKELIKGIENTIKEGYKLVKDEERTDTGTQTTTDK